MSTTHTVHLAGGGPGAMLALRSHFKASLEGLPAKPLVAYVGAASGDNPGFQATLTGSLALTGARFRAVHLASARASVPAARALLDACDLVFLSGGDVDHGMNVLHERGILPHLRALCRQGKPMFGISAGSVMLAREWVRFPDDDDSRAEIFECIGAVPFVVDAHAEEDDWSELRTLLALQRRRGDVDPVGYGLTKKGALAARVSGDEVSLRALGTDIPRLVVRGDVAEHGEPLRLSAADPRPQDDPGPRPAVRKT